MSRYKFDKKTNRMLVLDEETGKWKPERKKKGKFDFNRPVNFVPDIQEFVSYATDKPVLIGSRSKLRAYERANNIRQCGDFRKGEIVTNVQKRKEQAIREIARLNSESRPLGGGFSYRWE